MASSPQVVDLRAKVVNIQVMHGDTWSVKVTIASHDLTGATVAATLQPKVGDPVDLDVNVSSPSTGEFYLGQDAATTSGSYDVQITPNGGLPRTYIRGTLSTARDVTP